MAARAHGAAFDVVLRGVDSHSRMAGRCGPGERRAVAVTDETKREFFNIPATMGLQMGDGRLRNPAFGTLLDEIKALHDSKNHDYAENDDPLSNLRRSEAFGIPAWKGVLVRLTDKWSRIEQLAAGKEPKHESLRDSLIDNAVYSLLAVLLLDEQERARREVAHKPGVYVAKESTSIFAGIKRDEDYPLGERVGG